MLIASSNAADARSFSSQLSTATLCCGMSTIFDVVVDVRSNPRIDKPVNHNIPSLERIGDLLHLTPIEGLLPIILLSSCSAIPRLFSASSSLHVINQTFTVALAALSIRTTLLCSDHSSHRCINDNTPDRLEIFDLTYDAPVSTHMSKPTSVTQIEISTIDR